jgi:hypothetical protein
VYGIVSYGPVFPVGYYNGDGDDETNNKFLGGEREFIEGFEKRVVKSLVGAVEKG